MANEGLVHIVEDDAALRNTLVAVLNSVGLKTEAYESGVDFLAKIKDSHPGCIVLDVRLPVISGPEVQRQLRERGITLPIVIITGNADVPLAVQAMKDGAVDVIEKPFRNQALIEVVQRCIAQDEGRARNESRRREYRERAASLSAREKEVLELLINGATNKDIARTLNISIKTVEAHRANLMRKMDVMNLAGLVSEASLYGEKE